MYGSLVWVHTSRAHGGVVVRGQCLEVSSVHHMVSVARTLVDRLGSRVLCPFSNLKSLLLAFKTAAERNLLWF